MNNLLKKIKGFFNNIFDSRPAKVVKGVTYIAGGLLLLAGLMQVVTYTVTSYRGLAKAVAG